jgi:release factor glutamine methyltransferase
VYTIGEILNRTARYLQEKGLENARLNAEALLSAVLDTSRIDLYLRFDRPLGGRELSAVRDLIKRRLSGHPLQYLTGQTEFYSLTLRVSPAALIPRPETEILVSTLMQRLDRQSGDLAVADVGTGCGNIVIALAVHMNQARLWATDRSPEALALARENARAHGVEERIGFLQGDLLAPLKDRRGRLAAVISNPPYVSTDELKELPVEIREHEPREALDGGPDGLDVIRRLIPAAADVLAPEGWLALEIGAGQAGRVEDAVSRTGVYGFVETIPDYNGIPRIVLARKTARTEPV